MSDSKTSSGGSGQPHRSSEDRQPWSEWKLPDNTELKTYKHSDRHRQKNRRAQARYRERQRARQAGQEGTATDVTVAHAELQAERAAFAAEKQAWQSIMRSSQHQQQPAQWLVPDMTKLALRHSDTYMVGSAKAGLPASVLDISYALACVVHRTCKWPLPSRDQSDAFRLDSLFERKKQHRQAMIRLLEACDSVGDKASYARLEEFTSLLCAMNRAIGWSAMTAGNDLARIVDTEFTKAGIREYGLPAADHWERAAALLNLTGQQARRMLQLRAQWLQRRSQARQQLTNIPSRINAFILDQAGDASNRYPSSCAEGENCHLQLRQCLAEDHEAASDFFYGVREQVLTPHQNATLLMAAWPYKMDISGLCNALADLSARHSQAAATSIAINTPCNTASPLSTSLNLRPASAGECLGIIEAGTSSNLPIFMSRNTERRQQSYPISPPVMGQLVTELCTEAGAARVLLQPGRLPSTGICCSSSSDHILSCPDPALDPVILPTEAQLPLDGLGMWLDGEPDPAEAEPDVKWLDRLSHFA